jgi:hypothetical protein
VNYNSEDPETLVRALKQLHKAAKYPSAVAIANLSNGGVSPVMVGKVLGGYTVRWPRVRDVVEALGGDPELVKPLWEREMKQLTSRRYCMPTPAGAWRAGGEFGQEIIVCGSGPADEQGRRANDMYLGQLESAENVELVVRVLNLYLGRQLYDHP